jgi:hypothetical protein
VRPWLPELIDQAVRLLLRLGGRVDELPELTGQRVVSLLLHSAGSGLRVDEVRTTPVIPVLPDQGEPMRISVARLAELAEARGGLVDAVLPGQNPRAFLTAGPEVAVLSVEQRGLLADLLGVRFQSPPRRPVGRALVARVRRALSGVGARALGVAAALKGERPLPGARLDEVARGALPALQAQLGTVADGPREVVVVSGVGPVRLDHRRRLILPRHNPTVAAALVAVRRDPLWLHPVLTALLGEVVEPPAELRARWLRAAMRGRPPG